MGDPAGVSKTLVCETACCAVPYAARHLGAGGRGIGRGRGWERCYAEPSRPPVGRPLHQRKEFALRRRSAPLSLVACVAVGLVGLVTAGGARPLALAQGGTPAAGGFVAPVGLRSETLGLGTTGELPPAPAGFTLSRVTIEPGGSFPAGRRLGGLGADATLLLVVVESGTLTLRVEAPLYVLRAAARAMLATPDAGPIFPEEVPAGTEVVLAAGDSTVLPPRAPGAVRNPEPEPAVVLLAAVEPYGGDVAPAATMPAS